MPHRDHETRLRDLRALCVRADELRAVAEELCRSLQEQLESQMSDVVPGPSRSRERRSPARSRARRRTR